MCANKLLLLLLLFYSFENFSLQSLLIVFHWGLSDSMFPQVFRTFLSILAEFNNAVVWVVSIRPLISNSSSPCAKPLVTVPSTLITNDITITFIFHSFFSSLAMSWYLSLYSFSFSFTLWQRLLLSRFSSFFLLWTITRSGRLTEIIWSVSIWKSQRILCVSFFRTDSGLNMNGLLKP